MTDLLIYTDRIVLPYKPRTIVVNEGGNDILRGDNGDDNLDGVACEQRCRRCRSLSAD